MLRDGPHTHPLGEKDLFPELHGAEESHHSAATDTLTTSELQILLRRMGLSAQGGRAQLVKRLKGIEWARR